MNARPLVGLIASLVAFGLCLGTLSCTRTPDPRPVASQRVTPTKKADRTPTKTTAVSERPKNSAQPASPPKAKATPPVDAKAIAPAPRPSSPVGIAASQPAPAARAEPRRSWELVSVFASPIAPARQGELAELDLTAVRLKVADKRRYLYVVIRASDGDKRGLGELSLVDSQSHAIRAPIVWIDGAKYRPIESAKTPSPLPYAQSWTLAMRNNPPLKQVQDVRILQRIEDFVSGRTLADKKRLLLIFESAEGWGATTGLTLEGRGVSLALDAAPPQPVAQAGSLR